MYAGLSNVTTDDEYGAGNTVRLPGTRRITMQVANAGIHYQLDESRDGKGQWTDERFLGPSIGSLSRICSGMRIRSARAGAPAQVTVELYDDEGADNLAAFTSRVSADGGIDTVLPGSELAHGEFAADVIVPAGVLTAIVAAPAVSVDGTTAVMVEFYCPQLECGSGSRVNVLLYEDGLLLRRMAVTLNVTTDNRIPTVARYRFTPSAGEHVYQIRILASGAGVARGATSDGGDALAPGFLRLTAV